MMIPLLLAMSLVCLDPVRMNDLTAEWETPCKPVIWGFHNLYNAMVVPVPDKDYPYRLFFFGYSAEENNPDYPGGDAIFLARGKDLDTWEIFSGTDEWDTSMNAHLCVPVLYPNPDAFDNMACGDPSVVYRDGNCACLPGWCPAGHCSQGW